MGRTGRWLAVSSILLIVAMLLPVVPVNTLAEEDNSGLPLMLAMYKYRRMMAWERQWASDDADVWLLYGNGTYKTINIAEYYEVLWQEVSARFPIFPKEPLNRLYNVSGTNNIYLPYPESMNRSYINYIDYCLGLLTLTKTWIDVVPNYTVNSDIESYQYWLENISNYYQYLPGLYPFLLYFLDHVPGYISEGDAYATWCLPFQATKTPTINTLVTAPAGPSDERDYVLTVEGLSVDPVGAAALLAHIDYEFDRYTSLGEALDTVMPSLSEWSLAPEDVVRRNLYLDLLAQTYYPIYNDLRVPQGLRGWEQASLALPGDEAFILQIFPYTVEQYWWIQDSFHALSHERTSDMDHEYNYNFFEHPVRAKDFAPLYAYYTGSAPAGSGLYTVTIWVEGPALIAPATKQTIPSRYIPGGAKVTSVNPGMGPFFDDLTRNTSIIRGNYTLDSMIKELNRAIELPNNVTRWLGSPYPFIVPGDAPRRFVQYNVDLSDPRDALERSVFMVYFNPYELSASPGRYAVLHIRVTGEGLDYVRHILVSASGEVFDLGTYNYNHHTRSSYSYTIGITDQIENVSLVSTITGKITFEGSISLTAEATLLRYEMGAKTYSIKTGYTIHDKATATLHARDIFRNYYLIHWEYNMYDPSAVLCDRRDGLSGASFPESLNSPITVEWDISMNMTYEIIVGGTSPFPNAALPYWPTSAPSPTLIPGFIPRAGGIFYMSMPFTPGENGQPELARMRDTLPGPLEALGNIIGMLEAYLTGTSLRYWSMSILMDNEGVSPQVTVSPWPVPASELGEPEPEWMYTTLSRLRAGGHIEGYTTFAPAMIRNILYTSTITSNPILSHPRIPHVVWQWYLDSDMYRYMLSLLPIKPTTNLVLVDANIPALLTILTSSTPLSKDNITTLYILTQYPIVQRYNLTLPFYGMAKTDIVIYPPDYGINYGYISALPSGSSWYKYDIPYWAIAVGTPALLQSSDKNLGFYKQTEFSLRFGPLDAPNMIEPDRILIKRGVRFYRGVVAYPNKYWLPFGDGRMTVPIFIQVVHPEPARGKSQLTVVEAFRVPYKYYAPGENVTIFIRVKSLNPVSSVLLSVDTEGDPVLFKSVPSTVPLTPDPSTPHYYVGSVTLELLNRSELLELINGTVVANYTMLKNYIIVKTVNGSAFASVMIPVLLKPGVIIYLSETSLNMMVPTDWGVLPVSYGQPYIFSVLGDSIELNISNDLVSVNRTYTEDSPEFFTMVLNLSDANLSKGVYDVSVTLSLRVPLGPSGIIMFNMIRDNRSFSATRMRSLMKYVFEREEYKPIKIRINFENVRYDPNETLVLNATIPIVDIIHSLILLYMASGQAYSLLSFETPYAYTHNGTQEENYSRRVLEVAKALERMASTIYVGSMETGARNISVETIRILINSNYENLRIIINNSDVIIPQPPDEVSSYVATASGLAARIESLLAGGQLAMHNNTLYTDEGGLSIVTLLALTEALYELIPEKIVVPYSYLSAYGLTGSLVSLSNLVTAQTAASPPHSLVIEVMRHAEGLTWASPPSALTTQELLKPLVGTMLGSVAVDEEWGSANLSLYGEALDAGLLLLAAYIWNALTPANISEEDARGLIVSLYEVVPAVYSQVALIAYSRAILLNVSRELANASIDTLGHPSVAARLLRIIREYKLADKPGAPEGYLDELTKPVIYYTSHPLGPNPVSNAPYYAELEWPIVVLGGISERNAGSFLDSLVRCNYSKLSSNMDYGSFLSLCASREQIIQPVTDPLPPDAKLVDMSLARAAGQLVVALGAMLAYDMVGIALNRSDASATPINMTDWFYLDDLFTPDYYRRPPTPYPEYYQGWRARVFREVGTSMFYQARSGLFWLSWYVEGSWYEALYWAKRLAGPISPKELEIFNISEYISDLAARMRIIGDLASLRNRGYNIALINRVYIVNRGLIDVANAIWAISAYSLVIDQYLKILNNITSNMSGPNSSLARLYIAKAAYHKTGGDASLLALERAASSIMAGEPFDPNPIYGTISLVKYHYTASIYWLICARIMLGKIEINDTLLDKAYYPLLQPLDIAGDASFYPVHEGVIWKENNTKLLTLHLTIRRDKGLISLVSSFFTHLNNTNNNIRYITHTGFTWEPTHAVLHVFTALSAGYGWIDLKWDDSNPINGGAHYSIIYGTKAIYLGIAIDKINSQSQKIVKNTYNSLNYTAAIVPLYAYATNIIDNITINDIYIDNVEWDRHVLVIEASIDINYTKLSSSHNNYNIPVMIKIAIPKKDLLQYISQLSNGTLVPVNVTDISDNPMYYKVKYDNGGAYAVAGFSPKYVYFMINFYSKKNNITNMNFSIIIELKKKIDMPQIRTIQPRDGKANLTVHNTTIIIHSKQNITYMMKNNEIFLSLDKPTLINISSLANDKIIILYNGFNITGLIGNKSSLLLPPGNYTIIVAPSTMQEAEPPGNESGNAPSPDNTSSQPSSPSPGISSPREPSSTGQVHAPSAGGSTGWRTRLLALFAVVFVVAVGYVLFSRKKYINK